jgi:hypothetical protein
MKTVKLEVTFNIPRGTPMADIHNYVKQAVDGWGGCFHPDDPFFGNKDTKVKTLAAEWTGPGGVRTKVENGKVVSAKKVTA